MTSSSRGERTSEKGVEEGEVKGGRGGKRERGSKWLITKKEGGGGVKSGVESLE